ncbi:MAG: hypothetical protein LUC96_06575 [Alistipes sp.]|uniref:HAD domain-containing protein n=1 Tax=Alistipes sp. TaxID=1872444 RepID=UPI0025B84242|nr:HAD domain-containing protein [Alistipes sp.]MCD8274632.1 hypothetical protein [Alistipes sp.]
MERYVFLDFDGVLNTGRYQRELLAMGKVGRDIFGPLFDPWAVDFLRLIIERSGAQLVITSSWRTEGLVVMRELWQSRSLPGVVADVTPFYLYGTYRDSLNGELSMGLTPGCRGVEIAEWLARHAEPGAPYVILDDEEDLLLSQAPRFVRINAETGITMTDVRRAVDVLKLKSVLR